MQATRASADTGLPQDPAASNLRLLVRLRWLLLAAGLLVVVALQSQSEARVPPFTLLVALGLAATSNGLLDRHLRRGLKRARAWLLSALAVDVVLLTMLLHAGGGPSNPFSVFYLVYLTLAALMLGAAAAWTMTALSIAAYGSLFFLDPHSAHSVHDPAAFAQHLRAMWMAFSLTATFSAVSVVRLRHAITERDREIDSMRERARHSERLAALTTLAAGAAHELGTPLGTIAIATGEMERHVARLEGQARKDLGDDLALVRSQLTRCRAILAEMSEAGGEFAGETPTTVSLGDLISRIRGGLRPGESRRLRIHLGVREARVVPYRALSRVVGNLLRNAFDAGEPSSMVDLAAEERPDGTLRIEVRDRGRGMEPAVLARATDPFFSTRDTSGVHAPSEGSGTGMGLGMGLFLANALANQLGGRLLLESTPGKGTTATLEIPRQLPNARRGTEHE